MELILLKLVALFRALLSTRFTEESFSIIGIGLFGILGIAVLARAAMWKSLRISSIDLLILAFTTWCIARAAIYTDTTTIPELLKLLIPLLSYTIAKNVVPDRVEYGRVIFWIIVGFSIPALVSAGLIASGDPDAIATEKWQTGLLRWQGAYTGSHSLGHCMTLFLMALVLYISLREIPEGVRHGVSPRVENVILGFLGATALYCLYMSQVRSAVLGLLIFTGVFGYLQNKKALLLGGAAFVAVAVVTSAIWIPALIHEIAPDRRTGPIEVQDMGSGRLNIWSRDIATFGRLPIDQKLAGAGIGSPKFGGHNDWLTIFWNTGIIGFMLFVCLQILIFRAIIRMRGRERNVFLALFAAVVVMMAVSNSYNLRIQVSQLYYMMLAFIEIRPKRVVSEQAILRAV